jgi:hypothetical protein
MSTFDENRDSFLNQNEINDQWQFQGGDLNRDGNLSRGEFGFADTMLMNNFENVNLLILIVFSL